MTNIKGKDRKGFIELILCSIYEKAFFGKETLERKMRDLGEKTRRSLGKKMKKTWEKNKK